MAALTTLISSSAVARCWRARARIDKFGAQLRREGDIAQNGRREVCTKGGVYKLAARISVRIAYKMGARMLYAPHRMAARKFVQKNRLYESRPLPQYDRGRGPACCCCCTTPLCCTCRQTRSTSVDLRSQNCVCVGSESRKVLVLPLHASALPCLTAAMTGLSCRVSLSHCQVALRRDGHRLESRGHQT